jgi:hypothetical protein
MFGCVFQGKVPEKQRHNALGDWFGLDVTNPTDSNGPQSPWVMDPGEYMALKALHNRLKEAHAAQLIQVDYDEEDQPEGNPSVSDINKF